MMRLSRSMFRGFSSKKMPAFIPGNKAPRSFESPFSRYAQVLFEESSKQKTLDKTYEDIEFLGGLLKSEKFTEFVMNKTIRKSEQKDVLASVTGEFNQVTRDFLNLLIDNRLVSQLPKIVAEFKEYFRLLDKQEAVRVVSAYELSPQEKEELLHTLQQKLPSGFSVEYSVDPALLGGFHIYFDDKFLDCSLITRVGKLRFELQKIRGA